jgi:translation initiation factor IF-2
MAKEKVYKLAQEFRVSSEALVQLLHQMGIPVKSHMSTVDENLREDIKKRFDQERAEIKKEYERKKLIITKAKEDLMAKAEPAKEETKKSKAVVSSLAPSQQQQAPQSSAGQPATYRPREYVRPEYKATSPNSERITSRSFSAPSPAAVPPAQAAGGSGEGSGSGRPFKKGKKKKEKKKFERPEVDEFQLKANIKKTLAKIGSGSARKKYKKDPTSHEIEDTSDKQLLNVSEFVTAAELANMMHHTVPEVISKCLELGMFVTINQRLDFETIELLADEFGFVAQLMTEYGASDEELAVEDISGNAVPRSPVVTIMGHVDHGKTSLLDYIRKTNVIAGEAGGITQHIAAYEVVTPYGAVTFLDTPGHEAFTAMRARGSQITDVIVLVVAADAGVMPQTKEAIDHARAANVPLVIAINKVDLPTANLDRVKAELANYNVLVEDYGGQTSCVSISAKSGMGVDKLLEILALETQILEIKANPEGMARGVVIESELDKGRGPIATVLIQKGTLKKGDSFVTGIHHGRVRDMFNERGQVVESAGPSQPVLVLGLSGTPQAGDSFKVVAEEKEAREISARRRLAQKEREMRRIGGAVSLDHLYEQIKAGNVKTLNLIIKGDVDGSVEALAASLEKLSTDEIKVRVIHKSVGAVKETDINLAIASNAIIIGFHLSPNSKIREMAKKDGVDIRTYRIIYEAIDAVKKAMEGMLEPETKENILSNIEVRQVFKAPKIGTIAGCIVLSGSVKNGSKARIIREDVEIADTRISSLRRHKEDVREVQTGYECGVTLDNFTDFKEMDRIETYEEIQVARKLVL